MKSQYRGGDCLKRELGQFTDLRGAWKERAGVFFKGVDAPMHTMVSYNSPKLRFLQLSFTSLLKF